VEHHRGAARASPTAHSAAEAVTVGEAMDSGEHGGCRELWPSDRQALAALAATAGQDRATGAGPHAQTETVHLVTATVVRLVGTLAHGYFSEGFEGCPLHCDGQCWQLRPAPPTHAAARWRIVDVRHPSTWSDRPTVRGGERGGQTRESPLRARLWMTSCRRPLAVVTFHPSTDGENHGPARVVKAM